MFRLIAISALALGVAACSSSPFTQAAQVAPTSSPYAQPNIPQSQYECVTDEGYGRFTPCGTRD